MDAPTKNLGVGATNERDAGNVIDNVDVTSKGVEGLLDVWIKES